MKPIGNKMLASIALALVGALSLSATSLSEYVNKSKCDQVINKQLYEICYSYDYKGAVAGWVKLYGDLVKQDNVKKRPKFYTEDDIPKEYRVKPSDYNGIGNTWNRGHIIVADRDFSYSQKAVLKTYTMANIVPQSAMVNQKTWIKVEKYGRVLAERLGYINSITIIKYGKNPERIKGGGAIPKEYYRIYYNNDKNFEKCFKYENTLNVDWQNDKLRNHEIDCSSIKR